MRQPLGQRVVARLLRERKSEAKRVRDKAQEPYREKIAAVIMYVVASGMTQAEIAHELGVHQATISKYLRAQATPRVKVLHALVRLAKSRRVKVPSLNGLHG